MHWLPLVAMVIASALLVLQCPLPRLVAQTMAPGNDIRTSSSADHDPSDSRGDFGSSPNDTKGRTMHGTADAYNLRDNVLPSPLHKESPSRKKQSQETLAAGGGNSARTGDQMDFGSKDLRSPAHKAFQDNRVLVDYKSQGGWVQEGGGFEGAGTRGRKILLKDRDSDRTWGRKILSKDRDNDGTRGRRTLLKDLDKQENSLANRQLPNLPPEGRAGGESGNRALMPVDGLDLGLDEALQEDEELLLLASHPRVLFTASPTPPKHPPLQLLLESGLVPGEEEDDAEIDEEQTSGRMQPENAAEANQARDGESYRNLLLGLSASGGPAPGLPSQPPRRAARHRRQVALEGRERAVCESVSMWVTNRKTAMDFKMRNVTVVDFFETKKGNRLAQIFYETSCRGPKNRVQTGEHGVAGGDCLGVDKKHWASECRTKQTYVRAFTSDSNGRTFWNWIRIDSSCVCVLQSRNHRNNWQGRGTR